MGKNKGSRFERETGKDKPNPEDFLGELPRIRDAPEGSLNSGYLEALKLYRRIAKSLGISTYDSGYNYSQRRDNDTED